MLARSRHDYADIFCKRPAPAPRYLLHYSSRKQMPAVLRSFIEMLRADGGVAPG